MRVHLFVTTFMALTIASSATAQRAELLRFDASALIPGSGDAQADDGLTDQSTAAV